MNGFSQGRPEEGTPVSSPESSSTLPPERRTFLKWAVNGLGALFAAVLGVPAVLYLIDPRNRPAQAAGLRTVARLDELPVGRPVQAVLRARRTDAYTLYPSDVIGRVWLIRTGPDAVTAFTTICPHLGCSINFEDKQKLFICPCHGGTFDLAGQVVKLDHRNNPAPRGMDWLECVVEKGTVKVKYQDFKQGEAERIAVG